MRHGELGRAQQQHAFLRRVDDEGLLAIVGVADRQLGLEAGLRKFRQRPEHDAARRSAGGHGEFRAADLFEIRGQFGRHGFGRRGGVWGNHDREQRLAGGGEARGRGGWQRGGEGGRGRGQRGGGEREQEGEEFGHGEWERILRIGNRLSTLGCGGRGRGLQAASAFARARCAPR